MHFINQDFGYYEGDRISGNDIAVSQRPSQNHDWNGTAWVLNAARKAAADALAAQQVDDEAAKNTVKLNPVVQYLVNHTPAECSAKANKDVTDLASAKIMFGHFAEALCVLAKDKLRD